VRERELDGDGGAGGSVERDEPAAERQQGVAGDRKAMSSSRAPRGLVLTFHCIRWARTAIGDRDANVSTESLTTDEDATAAVLERVPDQVVERPRQERGVGHHPRRSGLPIAANASSVGRSQLRPDVRSPSHDRGQLAQLSAPCDLSPTRPYLLELSQRALGPDELSAHRRQPTG
jgi:hypothetical protein